MYLDGCWLTRYKSDGQVAVLTVTHLQYTSYMYISLIYRQSKGLIQSKIYPRLHPYLLCFQLSPFQKSIYTFCVGYQINHTQVV